MNIFTADFKNPPTAFYPVPWWAWNGELEFDEMRRQLDIMREQNIFEFFIFALRGLTKPDFLSEEWFEYVKFTLDEAEKRGMKVWIYDELNWPSGSAGGHVVKDHPEKREFVYRFTENRLAPGDFVPVNQENLILLQKLSADGKLEDVPTDEFGYFTNDSSEKCRLFAVRITPSSRPMTNVLGVGNCWMQRGALDMIDPESFKLWVDYIYGEYEKRFSDKFGNTIKGFFTDEPQTHDYDGPTVPYTAKLIELFRERYHYDPVPHLAKLFVDLEGAEEFRRNYHALVAEMFSANFAMLNDWCAKRGLLFTGHCIWEEIGKNTQSFTLRNGDPHKILKYFSAPGCDLLGHTVPYLKEKPGLHRSWAHFGYNTAIYTARYVSSTARWSGAERTMCEAFGVRDYHSSMAGQKLINDFLAAMGINLINDNTLIYTMSNGPGSKHFPLPMFDNYRVFTDCSARLSKFAAFGKLAAQVAVMVPISTVWSKTKVMEWQSGAFKEYADVFNSTGEFLLHKHIDFEYIFEDAPESAADLAEFKVALLPGMTVLPAAVADRLQQFRKNGGKLIAIRQVPVIAETSETLECDELLTEVSALLPLLPQSPYTITGEGNEDIVAALRSNGDESLLLIANQTENAKTLTLLNSFNAAAVELLDPDQGGVYTLEKSDKWQFVLSEKQSIIVRFADKATPDAQALKNFALLEKAAEKSILELDGNWQFDFGKFNAIPLELELRFDPFEQGINDKWFAVPPKEWYKVCNDMLPFDVRPNECSSYWVRGTFEVKERVPENLSLIFSNHSVSNVYLNGVECTAWSDCRVWDQDNTSCYIAPAARIGSNEFFVRINITKHNDESMKLAGERDRVLAMILAGNFAAAAGSSILTPPPAEIASGSWTNYGFAGLPGWGCYRKTFELDKLPENPVLVISDARDTVEVKLNGKMLASRAWKPFRFDLKDALQCGNNTLEISVSGGVGNLLWRTAYIPKAVTVDYGLLGSVVIKSDR